MHVAVTPSARPLLHVPGFQEANDLTVVLIDSKLPFHDSMDARRLAAAHAAPIPDATVRDVEQAGFRGIRAIGDQVAVNVLYDGKGSMGGVMLRYPRRPSDETLRGILDSVELDLQAQLDPLALVQIGFRDLSGWRVFPVAGPSVTLGEETKGLPKTVYWPATLTFIFQPTFPPEGKDLFWFSEGNLAQRKAKVLRKGGVTIDGMEGVEFEAEGTHEGREQTMYGVTLRGAQGCYMLVGTVDRARGAEVVPTMKRIAQSFHRAVGP